MKIKKGKTDPELYATDDWFIRQVGSTILQLRPTAQHTIKEMWTGSVNGCAKVGTFEIADTSWNYYSTARYDKGVGLFPGSLQTWGNFLAEYVNTITDPESIEEEDDTE